MRKWITLIVTVAPIACFIGCASEPMRTHINSEPPGARVEVNENYVGVTPIDVTLPQSGSHHKLREHITIRALALEPGKPDQEKQLYYNQWAPENILFDMNRQPPVSNSK